MDTSTPLFVYSGVHCRHMETSDKNARRRLIEEIVSRWEQKNPDKLKSFAETVREMRQNRPYENQGQVYKATIPGDLMNQLEFAISSNDIRLFDAPGELKWFCDKYPEFTIPYDRSEIVR